MEVREGEKLMERWIGQYFEPELPSQDWTCSYCDDNIANCCCD